MGRFASTIVIAFGVLTLLYLGIMLLGYFTFGDHAASNLLRNYAQDDLLAVLGRLATFVSILFGFPLAMFGLKSSCASLLSSAANSAPSFSKDAMRKLASGHQTGLTVSLLSLITLISVCVSDIGLV